MAGAGRSDPRVKLPVALPYPPSSQTPTQAKTLGRQLGLPKTLFLWNPAAPPVAGRGGGCGDPAGGRSYRYFLAVLGFLFLQALPGVSRPSSLPVICVVKRASVFAEYPRPAAGVSATTSLLAARSPG